MNHSDIVGKMNSSVIKKSLRSPLKPGLLQLPHLQKHVFDYLLPVDDIRVH